MFVIDFFIVFGIILYDNLIKLVFGEGNKIVLLIGMNVFIYYVIFIIWDDIDLL